VDSRSCSDPEFCRLKIGVRHRSRIRGQSTNSSGRAEILIEPPCSAELEEVLSRPFRRNFDPATAMAEARRLAQFFDQEKTTTDLPKCRDPDDQKFLEAAAAAHADFLITKDAELLALARRNPPFKIVTPQDFAASAP
jgi:putative PIN family toxin of toxin-antitoxin system